MCRLPLVTASRGSSLIAVRGLLILLASLVAHRLSCPVGCGIFLDKGSNRCLCIGRQILNHWTTREVPIHEYFLICLFIHPLHTRGRRHGGSPEAPGSAHICTALDTFAVLGGERPGVEITTVRPGWGSVSTRPVSPILVLGNGPT